MAKLVSLILTLSFGCGCQVAHGPAPTGSSSKAPKEAPQSPTRGSGLSNPLDDRTGLPPDNPYRAERAGRRLDLADESPSQSELEQSRTVTLPDGGLLLVIGDLLARYDANGSRSWSYSELQGMIDACLIPATGYVYGTAGDNTMFILDATSGGVVYRNSRNGHAAYGEVIPFGDLCLVLDRFRGYREEPHSFAPDPEEVPTAADWIVAWRGTQAIWRLPIPPDAEVQLDGERALAVTRTAQGIYVKTLSLPPADRAGS
jgi:hypothetical protein